MTKLALAVVCLALASCGRSSEPRARWTFAVTPYAGKPVPDDLVDRVEQRVPKWARSGTSVMRPNASTLVIEGPLALDGPRDEVAMKLDAQLEANGNELVLSPVWAPASARPATERDFPERGVVEVDGELVAYAKHLGAELFELERGAFGTKAVLHEAGARVRLVSSGALAARLDPRPTLRFQIEVGCAAFATPEPPEASLERAKKWITDHPGASMREYDLLAPEQGGPPKGCEWVVMRDESLATHRPGRLLFASASDFSSLDVANTTLTTDGLGYSAVEIVLRADRVKEFEAFSTLITGCSLAIVLNDEIVTLARVNDRLSGSFVISAGMRGFTSNELAELNDALHAPPIDAMLTLVKREAIDEKD